MWIEFMQEALKDIPEMPLDPPPGIVKLWIDANTGASTSTANSAGFWEYFNTESLPRQSAANVERQNIPARNYNADKKPVETLF